MTEMSQVLKDFQKGYAAAVSAQIPEPNLTMPMGLSVSYSYHLRGPDQVKIKSIKFRGLDLTDKFSQGEIWSMEKMVLESLEEEIG